MYKIRNIHRGWWRWELHGIEPPSRAYVLISDLRISRRLLGDHFLIAVPSAASRPVFFSLTLFFLFVLLPTLTPSLTTSFQICS